MAHIAKLGALTDELITVLTDLTPTVGGARVLAVDTYIQPRLLYFGSSYMKVLWDYTDFDDRTTRPNLAHIESQLYEYSDMAAFQELTNSTLNIISTAWRRSLESIIRTA